MAWILAAALGSSLGDKGWAIDRGELTVRIDQPGAKISPMFYGLMTEEINHAYDGGLYAELIQNRIFKDGPRARAKPDPASPPHWWLVKAGGAEGSIMLDTSNPVNTTALTTSLRLDMKGGGGRIGVANDGFWGIPVKPNTEYRVSFYARGSVGFQGPLKVAIQSNEGEKEYASTNVPEIGNQWKKHAAILKTGAVPPSTANRFVISTSGDTRGTLWLNLVSLFPPTYRDRPNGLRIDLMEKLADLKPTFLRFPGGNYLEGPDYNNRFNWKTTIGPLEERPGHQCPWGYRSSDGLGLLEFLLWCEDLKMEPVLAVYAGLHIDNGRNIITGDALRPHVQDALDEIEYVTGAPTTPWGLRRAKDGHPNPFKLTYIEIGNEDNLNNGGPSYNDRFMMFYDAIKAKHPELKIIATTTVRTRRPDVIDDHLYSPPRNLERQSTRYDNASRNGAKVFMGEWASQDGIPTPTMNAALGDAAFLGGLERNSDLVVMVSYAPLLVNVGQNPRAAQWGTNLIGYNALTSFGSPSYYVQKMFSDNRGDHVLPVDLTVAPRGVAESPLPKGAVGVGTWETHSEFKDMKVMIGDQVVYSVDPKTAPKEWKTGIGDWSWDHGTLQQSSSETDCRATVGDPNWSDYTYTLKARKISGREGFLIMFHVQSQNDWLWWNVGGWGNTRTSIQKSNDPRELGRRPNLTAAENQWYDIKIEVKGRQIRCYLDGTMESEAMDDAPPRPEPMYVTACRDAASGEVILKVVNTESEARSIQINLQGARSVAKQAQVELLSGQPGDVNTVDNPTHVTPKKMTIENAAVIFSHEFPAFSASVMRLKVQ
jgi:alpha-L-arabinofuranosidase